MGNADDTASGSATTARVSGNIGTSINTLTSDDGNDVMMGDNPAYDIGEKGAPAVQQAPLAEAVFRHESNHSRDTESQDRPAELDTENSSYNSGLHAQTLHGHPITISQCVFQAHIGRYSKNVKLEVHFSLLLLM